MFKAIGRSQITTFSLMFGIIFLLNLNYTILKSVRKTLAIADLGGSATSIPFFELFGVLPSAIAMTWLLSKILKKYSMKKVFLITLFIFIFFFIAFAAVCYPKLLTLSINPFSPFVTKFCSMSFYVMGELWKPALIQILFLGLVNYNLTSDQAKIFYPPLMLGASLGAVFAGPLTVFCNCQNFWLIFPLATTRWGHSLISMMGFVFLFGAITAIFYIKLCKYFQHTEKEYEEERNFSLKEALNFFLQSKSLNLLGWIVFADYIAYSLVEVLFLEVLKQKYPLPYDYCTYMGYLSFAHSILTISLALVIAPLCLKRLRWVHSALILPISLLVIEAFFFFFLCSEKLSCSLFHLNHSQWLAILATLGSILFCSCRAVKYTIFDPCKELVFVRMHKSSRMKGKIIIDGLCSKFGKGASSAATLGFASIYGSLMASSLLTAFVSIGIALSLIFSTKLLSIELEKPALNRA
jgi:AAA family ATP:ADP antiporter